jgi:hypothetical protein
VPDQRSASTKREPAPPSPPQRRARPG